jgi:hypothetical protein
MGVEKMAIRGVIVFRQFGHFLETRFLEGSQEKDTSTYPKTSADWPESSLAGGWRSEQAAAE